MITNRLPELGKQVAVFFEDGSWACAKRTPAGCWVYADISGSAPVSNSENVIGWLTMSEAAELAVQRRKEYEAKHGVKTVANKVKVDAPQRTAKLHEYNGEKLTMKGWAKKVGMHRTTIIQRLKRGMTFGQALGLEEFKDGRKGPRNSGSNRAWLTVSQLKATREKAA